MYTPRDDPRLRNPPMNAAANARRFVMKNTHRALGLMAMLLLLSPFAAFAQARSFNAQGPYQDIQIQVKDLDSDQVIATVQPGGTVTLREGQRVRLIMTADHPG